MKIKITERARELYARVCPISTEKCESFEELNYKIQRSIDLGAKKKSKGDITMVQYYGNQFQIKDGKIINIQRTKTAVLVKESLKTAHYYKAYKVLV